MDDHRSDKQGSSANGEHIRLAPIDHDEYDALAELFLGGGGYAPEPIGPDDSDARPGHETHTPVLHLTGAGARTEEPAPPFHASSAGVRVIETIEESGDRASSLLRELMEEERSRGPSGEEDETDEMARMPRPQIEVVLLGHLPVRATLWARQYACSLAKENDETIALVRAASGSTAIDLVTGHEPIAAGGSSDMEGAIDRVSDMADRVVLRVDEASEPELLDRSEVGTITILTGADEAAVVASYRLIKTLDASLPRASEDAPKLKLAVMGAGSEQARDACEKLRSAVKTFISRPIEIVAGAGRIDATGTTNIYRDAVAHPAGHIIDGLVRAAHREEPDRHAPADHAAPAPGEVGEQPVIRTRINDASAIEPKPLPDRSGAHAKRTSSGVEDGLCVLVPGLRTIETRCPRAPGVELATDDAGRLHLLVCDADTSDAINRLYAAQNWARDHLALLLRAEPGLRMPGSDPADEGEATMHLISGEPSAVREIYDTPIRVYSLARIRVAGVIAQVATPLN